MIFNRQGDCSSRFEFSDLLLRETIDGGGNGLHQLAELLAHRAEVALHFLHENALSFDKREFLDIHLVHNQLLHSFDVLLLLGIDGRNHNFL